MVLTYDASIDSHQRKEEADPLFQYLEEEALRNDGESDQTGILLQIFN